MYHLKKKNVLSEIGDQDFSAGFHLHICLFIDVNGMRFA